MPLWHHVESTIGPPSSLSAGEKVLVIPGDDIVGRKIVNEPSIVGVADDPLRIEREVVLDLDLFCRLRPPCEPTDGYTKTFQRIFEVELRRMTNEWLRSPKGYAM
jgi:hypothetical protein